MKYLLVTFNLAICKLTEQAASAYSQLQAQAMTDKYFRGDASIGTNNEAGEITVSSLDEKQASIFIRQQKNSCIFGAWLENKNAEAIHLTLVGMVSIGWIEADYTLFGLYILPAFRRQSVANQLLKHVVQEVKVAQGCSVRLEVLRENLPAIALYKKNGFETLRRGDETLKLILPLKRSLI